MTDHKALIARVAEAMCRSEHPNLANTVFIPHDADPRMRVAACFACQRAATAIPAALGAIAGWEYGIETAFGMEWGASVGMSHRYEYTAESVHALAGGRPVFRRQRTTLPDFVGDSEPYPRQ